MWTRYGWLSSSHQMEQNQFGFRGRKIQYKEDDFVVLLLGDSQVEALSCSYYHMPERTLETTLQKMIPNARVFSLGTFGYGQDQALLALNKYFSLYRADVVLHWFTPSNDLWNNLFPSHNPEGQWPKPTFSLSDGALMGPQAKAGQPVFNYRVAELWHRYFPVDHDANWEKTLPPPYQPLDKISQPFSKEWEQSHRFRVFENIQSEKSHRAIYLSPRSPRMEYAIQLGRSLLEEMQKQTHKQGGKFFVFFTTSKTKQDAKERYYRYRGKYYLVSKEQKKKNISDFLSGFPHREIQLPMPFPRQGPRDRHLNQYANDFAMKQLASVVARR